MSYLPIYLSIKDVQKALDVSQMTAKRRIGVLKDAMQLPKYKKITVLAFCNYYDIPIDTFYQNMTSSAKPSQVSQNTTVYL
jgi:hypothetical protein